MSPLPSQRTRRRIAFAILAVWLFALGAGWANACALQQRGTHVHESASSSAPVASHAVVVQAGHIGADSAHDEADASAAGKACLKACDDGAQTVVSPASVLDPAEVAMAPPVATLWTAHAVALASVTPKAEAGAIPGAFPPLRTRYSRLAL